MTGLIFDIQRFSLNDGPGIRTTVFFKGCHLNCVWCHNPESKSFEKQLSFNSDKCINCYDCVNVCPENAHQRKNNIHVLNWQLCNSSGKCVEVCSTGALSMTGYEAKVDEILHEVMKDVKYFDESGGGLTVSGGEPMAQFEFTIKLLKAAKEYNLHTVLDTCGFAGTDQYRMILPYVNLFLFDYKLNNDELHKHYTGAGNRLILKNLDFLYKSKASIVLRCPLIPGINDTDAHLSSIRDLTLKYPNLNYIEIMPYHDMGRSKAERTGLEYNLPEIHSVNDDIIENWKTYFSDLKNKIIISQKF